MTHPSPSGAGAQAGSRLPSARQRPSLLLPHVPAFRELLQHLAVERGYVVGLAAGHQAVVADHLLIDPVGAGVLQVVLQRRPRGHLAALDGSRLAEGPGARADGRGRLSLVWAPP